jgi:hypothetical protein
MKLKAAEGMYVKRPNGTIALKLLSFDPSTVDVTTGEDGRVKVTLEFDGPFIHPTDKRPRHVRKDA